MAAKTYYKLLMTDLKKAYSAVTEDEVLENLMTFKEKRRKQYPSCVKSWEDNWGILSIFFAYPTEIRKIIYTTNIIEGLNRQFRQITKNKPSLCSRTVRLPEPGLIKYFRGKRRHSHCTCTPFPIPEYRQVSRVKLNCAQTQQTLVLLPFP